MSTPERPGPAQVAERFRDIFVSEETGSLQISCGETHYAIRFHQGLAVGADKSHAGSAPTALPCGGAGNPGTSEQCPEGERSAAAAVTAQAVADSGAALAIGVFEEAFACEAESVTFVPEPASLGEFHGDLLRSVEMFLAGVRAISRFEAVHEALMSSRQRLVLRPNPSVPLEHLALKPIHGFLLSRLDGSLCFGELSSMLGPVEEAEAARFVYALLLLGSVALDPPLGPGLFRTELLLSHHLRDAAREESEVEFIRDTYAALQGQSPYQILGVAEIAGPEEIQNSYRHRKDAIGSDRFLERVREKMSSELRIIDARLTEAYLALQSGSRRAPERAAGGKDGVDFDALALRRELSKTEAAVSVDEQEKQAEQYYYTAKKYYTQADYHNCVQYCNLAIRQSEGTARYHALLGEAQARNPDHRWQKMAEQSFLKATVLDPWNADYSVLLGQLYKKQGLKRRAQRQFERALELQPGHPKASEELGLVV